MLQDCFFFLKLPWLFIYYQNLLFIFIEISRIRSLKLELLQTEIDDVPLKRKLMFIRHVAKC